VLSLGTYLPEPRMTSDDRPAPGLIPDVLDVLERHGYHQYDNRHTGQAIGAILDLAYVYDGTRDVSYGYHTPWASHAGAQPSGPGQDDAVILTDAEVHTVVAALDIAADYKRDRAAALLVVTEATARLDEDENELLTSTEVLTTSCTLGVLVFLLGWLVAAPRNRPAIARVALETLVSLVVAGLIALPYVISALGPDRPAQLPQASTRGTDLASLLVPWQVTWIRHAGSLIPKLPPVPEQGSFFVAALLASFCLALWRLRRQRATIIVAVLAAVAFVFSLSSLLRVAGHPHPSVPLPWRIAAHIPLAQVAIPDRLIMYAWFAVAVAIALWLAAPARWRPRGGCWCWPGS